MRVPGVLATRRGVAGAATIGGASIAGGSVLANHTGQGPGKQPKQLGTTFSVILGVVGTLASILAFVQLLTTENALIITLLLAVVLGLAGIIVHFTWHSRDPRLKWLGSLMVAVLVLTSLGGGYGLGRAITPSPAAPGRTTTAGPGTAVPVATGGSGTTTSIAAPATTPPAGALVFARVEPATDNVGSFDSWKTTSVSVEAVEYDEAVVVDMAECRPDKPDFAEYVIGRKYKRLTGKVTLADDSQLTKPVPFAIALDDTIVLRKNVTTTPLDLNVDLSGVNRIRFELTPPGNSCNEYSKIAFVGLVAQP